MSATRWKEARRAAYAAAIEAGRSPEEAHAAAEAAGHLAAGLAEQEARAAAFTARAEAERLRKTIVLADEAIREAATLRSTPQPGEDIATTGRRWDHAHQIETAALACRKAARAALSRVTGLVVTAPERPISGWIEDARSAALALKAAIDRQQEGSAK